MSTKTDLAALGWRVDSDARLVQAIRDFQIGYTFGPDLKVDGDDGPATRAALALVMGRLKAGLKTASANFNFTEFRCACGGADQSCRRIWVHRELVRACERYRAKVGPLDIVRGCRCPTENRRVGGKSSSQHLFGTGADLKVFAVTVSMLRSWGIASGIGHYDQYVRHIDVRHVWGNSDPVRNYYKSTIANPATWPYGSLRTTPLPLNPPKLSTPSSASPAPSTSEEDDMTPQEAQKAILYADVVPSKMLGERNPTVTPITAMQFSMEWSLAARNSAREAARDAAAGLEIIKAQAAKGGALTAEEIEAAAERGASRGAKQALDEEISGATVNLNVTKEG
jgi:hypothetical protein